MTLDARRLFEELQRSAGLDPAYTFGEGYAAVQNGTAALLQEDGTAIFCSHCRDFRGEHLQRLAPEMGEHTVIILPELYEGEGSAPLPRAIVLRKAVCVVRRDGVTFIAWDWFNVDGMRKVERDQAEAVIYGPLAA